MMFFEKIGANYDDLSVFKEMGIDILRMDVKMIPNKNVK